MPAKKKTTKSNPTKSKKRTVSKRTVQSDMEMAPAFLLVTTLLLILLGYITYLNFFPEPKAVNIGMTNVKEQILLPPGN